MGATRIEVRVDAANVMNWTNFTTIQTNINASNFGVVTGTAPARVVQAQVRVSF